MKATIDKRTFVWYHNNMNKAIKYRVYPTSEQSVMFIRTFGCCRKVWNLMLSDKISHFQNTGKTLMTTPAQYKKEFPFLKEVDSLALANVQLNLQTAYKNCFDKSRRKRNNFPKFKSRKHFRNSYTTNNQNGTVAIVDNNHIRLPKIGKVKAVIHRLPEDDWIIKSATVSRERDGSFYISVLFEFDRKIIPVVMTDNVIGLDYKSDGLYMDSNGNTGSNHKFYKDSQEKLAKAQRKLSRMTGSKKNESKSRNYLKQLQRINRIHRHISNQRLDNLHKKSTEIANQYDAVCVESLNMQSLSNKGFGNGKAILDNGYGMFLNMLEYKLADRGKRLIRVDKWYPSTQICSRCGSRRKLLLSERVYRCCCGLSIDRDLNAAINIKEEGLRILNAS